MTNIVGTDVSFYESPIDFRKMKSAAEFTIIKVGQRDFIDPDFYTLWHNSKGLLPRGSYWFYDKRNTTPEGQAELWIKTMNGDYGELPLFADYEGIIYGGNDIANFKRFLERVKQLVPEKEVFIYTGRYFWKDDSGYNSSYAEFFKQFPLWIAAYGASPVIPAPWTEWTFWQYTDKGNGTTYGCGGGSVDLNYFNGDEEEFKQRFNLTEIIPPANNDQITNTHKGVKLHIIRRFDTNCWIHVIDPKVARVEISSCGFRTPKYAQDKYGCQITANAGGWPNSQDSTHRSNEMWVSNGVFMQQPQYIKDNRPYIDISKDGTIRVSPNAQVMPNLYNSAGYDRLLVIDGKFNTAITDRTTLDARTASGMTADGKLILLSVEGNDQKWTGLNFLQMAEVLIEFGVITGGNHDGGSSSSIRNTAISDEQLFVGSDGAEAPVINHLLVFAEPTGETIPEPPTGVNMLEVLVTTKLRPTPSMYNTATVPISAGTKFESLGSVTGSDPAKPFDMGVTFEKYSEGGWIPREYKGVAYLKELTTTPPVSGEDVHVKVDIVDGVTTVDVNGVKYVASNG